MSNALQKINDYRLGTLKELLSQTTEEQQMFFKRMYSHKDLQADINDVVDKMPDEKINWAIQQVERTVIQNHSDLKD